MNRKAFELAISTLILIILGTLVLIGLIFMLTGGFERLRSSTSPLLDQNQASSIKQTCSNACSQQNKLTFCCKNYTIDNININCRDSRLDVNCALDCTNFNC